MIRVHVESRFDTGGVDIYIIREDQHGQRAIAKPMKLEWEKVDGIERRHDPSLQIVGWADELLAALSEGIRKNGIAPQEEVRLRGFVEAQERHLSDMRRLVFRENDHDEI